MNFFSFILTFMLASLAKSQQNKTAVGRRFIQISDIHLDVNYEEDSKPGPPTLCRGTTQGKASRFGDYRCDSPKILVKSAFKAMKKYVPDPEFILWTGDSSAHDYNLNQSDIMSNLRFVTQNLHQTYPGVPVIPVLGNHDSGPADNFPIEDTIGYYSDYITAGSFGDLLHSHSQEAEQFKKCGFYVLKNASYDVNVTQTFIVLNTALYYHNKALENRTDFVADPCGQLAWLNQTLKNCSAEERVFIVAHVPPGYFEHMATYPMFSHENYTKTYMDIITQKSNANKIVAHFYGHTHTDSFRLFMDSKHKIPMGVAFIAPSITPLTFIRDGVNPSFRSYQYDHLEREIINYEQFYLPLDKLIDEDNDEYDAYENQDYGAEETETNNRSLYNSKRMFKRQVNESNEIPRLQNETESERPYDIDPESDEETTTLANNMEADLSDEDTDIDILFKDWSFGYNAAADFNIKSMNVKELHKVYSDMKMNPQGDSFKYFWRHAFVFRSKSDGLDCNSTCHADIICTLTDITEENFKDCLIEHSVLHDPPPKTSTTLATTTSTTTKVFKTTFTYWTTARTTESQYKEPVQDNHTGHSDVVRGVVIGLALVALISMALIGLYMYRKMQRRRYCSQEFLLDSFRYDGYSQLDQPAST